MPQARVILTLLFVQVLFGTLPLTGQVVMRWMPPIGAASLRALGAAAVLSLVCGRRLSEVSLRDVPHLALYTLLAIVGNQVLFLEGLSRSTQINASVLITTIPVFTVAFALALRRERASSWKLAGIAVGLGGALLLARIDRFELSDRMVVGDLLVIANCSLWSLYLVLARPMLRRVSPLVMITWMFLLGALIMAPLGLPSAIDGLSRAPASALWAVVWMLAGPTAVAYLLNVWALRETESSQVAVFTYMQPLVAGLLAWGFAGESLSARTAVSAALIFAGVALVQVGGSRGGSRIDGVSDGRQDPGRAEPEAPR